MFPGRNTKGMNINKKIKFAVAVSLSLMVSPSLLAGELDSINGGVYSFSANNGEIYEYKAAYGADIIGTFARGRINNVFIASLPEAISGQTATYPPFITGVFEVIRNVYVSDKENFLRTLTYITNTGATDTTFTFTTERNVFSAARTYPAVMTAAVPMAVFDATNKQRSVAGMWGSVGATEIVDVLTTNTSSSIRAEWQNVAITAGQTIVFMEYTLATQGVGSVVGTTLGTDMLAGIPPADLAKVVNWDMTDANANGQLDLMETDSDSDGMADFIETALGFTVGSDDFAGDGDSDGLTDRQEYAAYTDPSSDDTDGDTLKDGAEINTHMTSPILADTDADGADDAFELANARDPLDYKDGILRKISGGDTDVHSPDIAISATGAMHISWMEYIGGNYQVMYALLDTDATMLIAPVQITNSAIDNQGHPAIAIDGDDKVYISWFDSGNPREGRLIRLNPLLAARDGSSVDLATIQTFAPATVTNCKKTDIAVDTLGNVHFSCRSSSGGGIQYAVFKNDGTELVAPFTVAGSSTGGGYPWPSMVLDSNNMAHMVWDRPQYAMVDGLNGNTLIAATDLSGPEFHNSLSLGSDGKVRIVSVSGSGSQMELTVLDPSLSPQNGSAGNTVTMNETITTISGANGTDTGFYATSVMGADGEIVITYNDGGGNGVEPIYFMKIDGAGVTTVDDTEIQPMNNNSYNTYMNYARMSSANTNLVVYATGEITSSIRLTRLDQTAYNTVTALSGLAAVPAVVPPTTTTPPPAAAGGSSSSGFGLSWWSLFGLPALVGLLRLRRCK